MGNLNAITSRDINDQSTPLIKERNRRQSLKLKTKTPETSVKSVKSKKRKRRKSQKAVKAQKGGIVRAGSHQKFPSCK